MTNKEKTDTFKEVDKEMKIVKDFLKSLIVLDHRSFNTKLK